MSRPSILDRYFDAVSPGLRERIGMCNVFFFGAGGSGKSFLKMYPELSPVGFIDNSPTLWGTQVEGIKVYPPEELKNQNPKNTVVFITSDYRKEILRDLANNNCIQNYHCLAGRPPYLAFDNQVTLFFQSFDSLHAAISYVSSADDPVVVLRDFDEFPKSTPSDVDVVASTKNYAALQKVSAGTQYFSNALRLDVYLEGYYARPYLPPSVMTLVRASAKLVNGVFVADTLGFAASFAYHTVLHKSPLFSGIDEVDANFNRATKFTESIGRASVALGLEEAQFTQEMLIRALRRNGWIPTPSELQRIAVAQTKSLQGNVALQRWAGLIAPTVNAMSPVSGE